MAEYSKKTVADLQEILKSRGLASSGKKADLIARLTEADKTAESKGKQTSPSFCPAACASCNDPIHPCILTSFGEPILTLCLDAEPEPEIEPAAEDTGAVEAAVPTTEEPNVEPTTVQSTDAQTTEQSATADAAAPTIEEKNFALNLAASDVDREMEKRKARAERFKTSQANAEAEANDPTTADAEVLRNLERAKRFGTGTTAIGMLDSALPSERERGPRGKKRNAGPEEDSATPDDPGLKQSFNRRGRHGRDKRRNGTPGAKPTGITKSTPAAYSNDKDRQAAEARKKRFAASS